MRSIIYVLIGLAFVSCSRDNDRVEPSDASLLEATAAVEELIAENADFDVYNTADEICLGTKYWYLDSWLIYNDDFTQVVGILSDLGGEPWSSAFEPVFAFRPNGSMVRYAMTDDYDIEVAQRGRWEFYPRTRDMFITLDENGTHEMVDVGGKLLALGDEVMVIETTGYDGKNLRAVFRLIGVLDALCISAKHKVDSWLSTMGAVDHEIVETSIVGRWAPNTELYYSDSSCEEVARVHMLFGNSYVAGGAVEYYTFNSDGTIDYVCEATFPDADPIESTLLWSYDKAVGTITIEQENGSRVPYQLIALGEGEFMWFREIEKRDYETQELLSIEYMREGFRRLEP